jgi:hypothetical protein
VLVRLEPAAVGGERLDARRVLLGGLAGRCASPRSATTARSSSLRRRG